MAYYNTYIPKVDAEEHIELRKVNNNGRLIDPGIAVPGTGTMIKVQYNPETIKYGKRIVAKENNATGEYSPPVELLGGNANTLSFVLRLNAVGEPSGGLVDYRVMLPDSKLTASQGDALFHQENNGSAIPVTKELYARLIFIDSLQYPNKEKVRGKYLKTPLVMIRFGRNHIPLVWVLDRVSFDVRQFDTFLNVQRADANVSFKLADCYYNTSIFEGSIPTMFFNTNYILSAEENRWEEGMQYRLLAGEKYENHQINSRER